MVLGVVATVAVLGALATVGARRLQRPTPTPASSLHVSTPDGGAEVSHEAETADAASPDVLLGSPAPTASAPLAAVPLLGPTATARVRPPRPRASAIAPVASAAPCEIITTIDENGDKHFVRKCPP